MDVALVTCHTLPEHDPDMAPLLAAFSAAGLSVAAVPWDRELDWSSVRLALLRSCWNYPQHPDAFLAWLERTAQRCALWNPLPVVRWNLHKGYLLELAQRGVAVTPTALLRRGDPASLAELRRRRGWDTVVVKPAVSGSSFATLRVTDGELAAGEAHLRDLLRTRDALVQPYLPAVASYGERALVWVDGELTHAVRKSARFAGQQEAVSSRVAIAPEEEALARAALATITHPLLYARVDVAPGPDGRPVLMELELLDPSLYLDTEPRAVTRLVAAVRRHLDCCQDSRALPQ